MNNKYKLFTIVPFVPIFKKKLGTYLVFFIIEYNYISLIFTYYTHKLDKKNKQ